MNRIFISVVLFCAGCFVSVYAAEKQQQKQQQESIIFDAQSIKDWMKRSEDKGLDLGLKKAAHPAHMGALIEGIAAFRQAMINDPAQAAAELAFDPRGFDVILKSPMHQKLPFVWQYFFNTSMAFAGHVHSNTPLVAYYNGFLDAVVYVQWQVKGKTVVPIKAAVDAFVVDALAQDEMQKYVPKWLTEDGTSLALLHRQDEFITDFEKKYDFYSKSPSVLPVIASSVEKIDILEGRAYGALLGVGKAFEEGKNTNVQRAWNIFHKALKNSDRKTLARLLPKDNIMSTQQILDLPQFARAQLTPVFVFSGEDVSVLYQHVASFPKFIGVLLVSNDPELKDEPLIESFAFFNLNTAEYSASTIGKIRRRE